MNIQVFRISWWCRISFTVLSFGGLKRLACILRCYSAVHKKLLHVWERTPMEEVCFQASDQQAKAIWTEWGTATVKKWIQKRLRASTQRVKREHGISEDERKSCVGIYLHPKMPDRSFRCVHREKQNIHFQFGFLPANLFPDY